MTCKKLLLIAALLLSFSVSAQRVATSDWVSAWRYDDADGMLAADPVPGRVVFMGNSITDFWLIRRPDFFRDYGFICRGISAQTTPQMLVRFRRDVVDTHAAAVVILAGTNDIAGNTGPATLDEIAGNIASMCEIAVAGGVRPIICSVLPAHRYRWAPEKRPDIEIPKLNSLLKQYADAHGITYVDFFSEMADPDPANENGLPLKYSEDGVHPTPEGYAVMEKLVMKAVAEEAAASIASRRGAELRLMSYNIRNCIGMDRETYDFRRVAEVINSCGPDVVAVQELDSVTTRSKGRYVLGRLAELTGRHAVFAPAIDYDGGKYGIGMLSLEKPLRHKFGALPGREENRALLMVEFENYIYCCTHLSLTEADRIASVKIIEKAVAAFAKGIDKPVFLAGDWNDTPDSEFMAKMSKNFEVLTDVSVFTCPSDKPAFTIDYIARWKGNKNRDLGEVVSRKVLQATISSDHLPVLIDLK